MVIEVVKGLSVSLLKAIEWV